MAKGDLDSAEFADQRVTSSRKIAQIGNAENESWGIEFGFFYTESPVIVRGQDATGAPVFDHLHARPTGGSGGRLPHLYLADDSALFDRLGPDFTLISLDGTKIAAFSVAADSLGMPLQVLNINGGSHLQSLGYPLLLVRPDQHIAWSGNTQPVARPAREIVRLYAS